MNGGSTREHPFSRILVVGADAPLAARVLHHFDGAGCRLVSLTDALNALAAWRPTLTALTVRDAAEIELLRAMLARDPDLPVIVAAEGAPARLALRRGAFAVVPLAPEPAHVRAALADVAREDEEWLHAV